MDQNGKNPQKKFVSTTLRFTEEFHTHLRVAVALRHTTIQAAVEESLTEWMSGIELPAPALPAQRKKVG